MPNIEELIATMNSLGYGEKRQFLQFLVNVAERGKQQLSKSDREKILEFAYAEVDRMRKDILSAENYQEKDLIFECENFLLGIVMHLAGDPSKLPEEVLRKIQALVDLVEKERYIETTIDAIYEQPTIAETDVRRLLYWVRQCSDEYQKSKLFLGLIHYAEQIDKWSQEAREMMAQYFVEELRRLPELDTEEAWNALELLADACKGFANDDVLEALRDLLQYQHNHVNFYVVHTLCAVEEKLPAKTIAALAYDMEFAKMTYDLLKQVGMTDLFPEECRGEEYLAKSDLVRWLIFPTELGKAPDEIVYLGKSKKLFSKEVFYIFKYRSDSDNLDQELQNQWLVGWSSNEGGTFSNFDLFAPFEQATPEQTVKLIRKKLIG